MFNGRRAGLIAYGAAVLGTGVTLMISLSLVPWFGYSAGLMTFFPVIIISAYLGGLGPGLLATVLGAAVGHYFFIEPRFSFAIADSGSVYAMGMFLLAGSVVSVLMESLTRSRRRIAASERRYAVTLASIGDAIIATDRKGRVTFLNPVAEALTGWPTAAAVGQPLEEIFRIVNEATREPVADPAAKVQRLGVVVGLANHTSLIARDGREVPIDDCGAPIVDDRGVMTGVVVVFRDVTQRRRAEEAEALSRANQRLELALRGSNVGVWFNDMRDGDYRKGRRHYINVWAQLGHEAPPAGEDDAVNVLHPDDRLRVEDAEHRYLAGETAEYEIESRLRHKDGSYRTMLARGVAVRDADGKPIQFAGVTIDITKLKVAEEELRRTTQLLQAVVTERKRAEAALRHANARVQLALRSSSISMWECDMPDGRIENARLTLVNVWESLGHDARTSPTDFSSACNVFFHPGDLERVGREIQALLAGDGREWKNEYRALTKDGSTRWLLARGTVLRDPDGKPIRFTGTSTDITDRKRVEEALRESEERFSRLARATNDAVWDWDLGTNKVWWNEGVHTLFGYRVEEDNADPAWWLERVHPQDRDAVEKFFFEVVRGKELTWVDEYRFRSADGSYKDVYDRGYVIRDLDGTATGMIGAMLDITGRKRAEEALRQVNARLDLAVRSSNISIWECDMPDGRIENANLTLINVWEALGYDAATSPTDFPSVFALLFHPDEQASVGNKIEALFSGDGQEYENEYRVRTKGGSTRWHLARGTVLRDSTGTPVRFIGTSADITDLKRAEEALRDSEERFRQLAENVRGVFWLQENEWQRLLYISPVYEEFWGRTCQSLYEHPRSWIESVHPEDRDLVLDHLEQQNRGTSTETNFRITRPDGSLRWMRCRAFPLKNQSGKVYRVGGLVEDITERRQFEEELRGAKEVAEAANRAKDDFLANVSHEIRTPMNAILGMTELALDTLLTDDQRQYLQTVKSAADNLLGIINELLDFAKIEAGKMELNAADFSLRTELRDTLRALAVRAHKKGLELICEVQPDVPGAVVGDAGRLRQVLLNLVGNAIKFTEAGEVEIRVEVVGDLAPQDVVVLHFTVRDTGIGIPPDKQDSIFRAFEQEDTSTTRKYGGTGLGLTIAARLVAMMGGQITVESEPRRGSTFAFTARFGRQAHPSEQLAGRSPLVPPILLRDLHVLVVDDNATNRRILEEWLRGWQMEPAAVGDGLAAMDALWDAVSAGRRYTLVLLDARMPDNDGLALAARIRKRPELAATRIILLTSGDLPGDWNRIRELQIDAHLLKPLQQDELLETIYRVMSRGGEAPSAAGSARRTEPAPTAAPLRVLVAEDNEFNAKLMQQLLGRRNHQVRLASNGREALALANDQPFDVMLLDIHMPELDGFQVAQAIRERERTTGGRLPIIALTARSQKEDREQCLAAGMDDFLAKPIQPAVLWEAIRSVTGREKGPAPGSRAPVATARLIDPHVLLAACDEDPAILKSICDSFRAQMPGHLAAVTEAARNRDVQRLRLAAHKLLGMVAAFSSRARDLALEIEDFAARGQLDEATALVDPLGGVVQSLERVLDNLTIQGLRHELDVSQPGDRA